MNEEHFETIQSLAPDERSRGRRLVVTMLPAVVLIAVIGAAIFGGGRSADDPSTPQRPSAGPAEAVVEASLAPDVEALRAAGFPTRALGLPVHSVARTKALRDDGEIRDTVVAVAGWLTVPPEPDCGLDVAVETDGPFGIGADCRRSTVLADDAEPVFAVRGGEATRLRDVGADAELRPQALPGASLAGIAAGQIAPDLVIGPSGQSCSAGLPIPGSGNASPRRRTAVRHSPSSASSGSTAAGACAGPRSTRPTSSRSHRAWSAGRSSIVRSAAAQSC